MQAMSRLTTIKHDVDFYANLMHQGKRFAISRYGDGEFAAILGHSGQNCDGCEYYPHLGSDLRVTLTKPIEDDGYFYAIGPMATRHLGTEIEQFVERESVSVAPWHSTESMLEASIEGRLSPLIRQLKAQRVLYVGPNRLYDGGVSGGWVAGMFPVERYLGIPVKNAYERMYLIDRALRDAIRQVQPTLIGFSAGMVSNLLIYNFWKETEATLIDFGSIWDGYAGLVTRSYHKKRDWEELRKANTR